MYLNYLWCITFHTIRTYTFKQCMHRCCPNIQFCEFSTCFKLCRGSKSKAAVGPDGKYKHFILLQIFKNPKTLVFVKCVSLCLPSIQQATKKLQAWAAAIQNMGNVVGIIVKCQIGGEDGVTSLSDAPFFNLKTVATTLNQLQVCF